MHQRDVAIYKILIKYNLNIITSTSMPKAEVSEVNEYQTYGETLYNILYECLYKLIKNGQLVCFFPLRF